MTPVLMPASYSPTWVALSFLISAVGAFVGLTAVAQLNAARSTQSRVLNLAAAALALGGIGIWSMHFIGMLAVRLNMGVSYALPETLGSLVAAVGASAAALHWVAARPTVGRVVGAGIVLGLAVLVMHYLGMAGMRFAGFIDWSLDVVAVSVAIALGAAIAGLWLAFVVRGTAARAAASAVIAVAVCAMHYTGMAAADFMCTSETPWTFPSGTGLVTSLELPAVVTAASLGMAVLIALDQLLQRMTAGAHRAAMARAAARGR